MNRAPRGRALGVLHGRVLGVLRELALTGGALAGTLCLVFAVLGATVDIRTLVFTSGSMTPAIRTGDLAITRPVRLAEVVPGDVLSVVDTRGVRVTHRVLEVDAQRNLLRLKGDANTVPDPLPYPTDRLDRVLFAVPAGGYVLTWLSSPAAGLLLGGYLAFLLWVLRPRGRTGQGPQRRGVGSACGVLLVIGLAVSGVPRPAPTLAAWTDTVPIGDAALSAYTVPKPVITGCSVALFAVTVTWTAVSTPYPLTYKASVVESGQNLMVNGTGGTRSATYPTMSQGMIGATHTIRITASLTATPSWASVPSNQVVRLPVVIIPPSCGSSS